MTDETSDETDIAADFYAGKNKITKWKETKYPDRLKRRLQNIIVRLPGVFGPAKQAASALECCKSLISDTEMCFDIFQSI